MTDRLRIAAAQINLLVGDVAGNVRKMTEVVARARDDLKADLVVFPELAVTGYPPEDLLLRADLIARAEHGLSELARAAKGIDVVVGYPHRRDGALYNAAAGLRDGSVRAIYHKHHLPNYGVFDEKRYFTPAAEPCVLKIGSTPVGITICEDLWASGPIEQSVAAGAKLVVNINASPYNKNKGRERFGLAEGYAKRLHVPFVYLNLVGGQDELVFDGESFALDAAGRMTWRAPAFTEGLYPIDFAVDGNVVPVPGEIAPELSEEESVYGALVLGVRDYVQKNRFAGAVIGLSGGIDSALTLCIAVDALGADRIEA
ncbi:MAG TPA: nitrilase-related carbon-nitrogen hydrolase, partial [Burkholderiales bacterium]|nr:nitrilase-related carbon-nitrogen hydrolase [Burkholderiales bacterium]